MRDGRGNRERQHPSLGRLPNGILSQELGAVFEREVDLANALLDIGRNRGEIASLHIGSHVHATRDSISMDFGGCRHDADGCHVLQAHMTARRRVDQQVLKAGHAVAGLGCAVHHHVEHLLCLEQAADLHTRHQRGRCPTHVARGRGHSVCARSMSTSISTVGASLGYCTCTATRRRR